MIWMAESGVVKDIRVIDGIVYWIHNIGDDDTEASRILKYDPAFGEITSFITSDGLVEAGTQSPVSLFYSGYDRLQNWDACDESVPNTRDCGSVYQCKKSGCVEHHTVSDGAHVIGVEWFQNRLYAVGGN
jgi:hypothetical protein